jgi:hypothetical protein
MAEHRFRIGQSVYFYPKKLHAPPGPYQITKRLPAIAGEFEYRIRTSHEDYERVARESELARLEDGVRPQITARMRRPAKY